MRLCKNTAVFLSALLCFNMLSYTSVSAADIVPSLPEDSPDYMDTENLILFHKSSLTSGSGKIYLSTQTTSAQTMAEIGVIDLEVQYNEIPCSYGFTPL